MASSPIALPELRDGDLRLRAPTDADLPAITRLCQDPEVQRWTRVPSPYSLDDARAFVDLHTSGLDRGTGVHLLAVDAGSDQLLGAIGTDIDPRDVSAEIGYWVGPDARGRGVATRGARLLLGFILDELGIRYVRLQAAVANPASNGVARKLGFTHEGTSRDAMLIGPMGNPTGPRGDANIWGLRPGELR